MHSRLARYAYTGDAHEIARRAEAELLPQYQQMPGFKAFSAAVTDDELFSLTTWDTADQAEAANTTAGNWVSGSASTSHRASCTSRRSCSPRRSGSTPRKRASIRFARVRPFFAEDGRAQTR